MSQIDRYKDPFTGEHPLLVEGFSRVGNLIIHHTKGVEEMSTGTYTTTDPDVRIKVVFDDEYPTENPEFPYAPGVLDDLIQCYEEGNYYGVILEKATVWTHEKTGDKMRFWDEEESIWGCAGYENVAEEVAKEFWNVTVTGRA